MFIGFLVVQYIDIETCQFGVIKTSGSLPVSVTINFIAWSSILGCKCFVWL